MNKIVVVTGASSGIGRQTAIDMAKDGYTVIGGARHIENDTELQQKGVITHYLDVTSHQSVQDFVNFVLDQYHTIDILINSAPDMGYLVRWKRCLWIRHKIRWRLIYLELLI